MLRNLLELTEFLLVVLLGFMPLAVIHWSDRGAQLAAQKNAMRQRVQQARYLAHAGGAALLVRLAELGHTVVI